MLTDDDKQWIDQRLKDDRQWVDQRLSALRAEIERVETSLLTEFHKWASPLEARVRTHAAALRALDLEMEQVQEKVKNIEGRSNP